MIVCIIASASAPSVPGRMGIHSSAAWAVRVRAGSMTMTLAPSLRACCTKGHRCRLLVSVLLPGIRCGRAWAKASVAVPSAAPMVYRYPSKPASEQMVRASWLAPGLV